MGWNVEIRKIEGGEVIKTIPSTSRRKAERVENGVNINLNHDEYYTELVEGK